MRHIIALSGGKDSAALAVYMHQKHADLPLELVFADTHAELPETYAYLEKIEKHLGQSITRIDSGGFDYWLERYGGYLPTFNARWCTKKLKIEPFKLFVGEDEATCYVGIRLDEAHRRANLLPVRKNIHHAYPFIDDKIDLEGVKKILIESGLGLPPVNQWRSHSSCYFCFFQRIGDWRGLYHKHPELWNEAKQYERQTACRWTGKFSLEELEARFTQEDSQMTLLLPEEEQWEQVEKETMCTVCST